MDNTGPYTSRAKLLKELCKAGKGTLTTLVLSAKTPATAPAATYTYAPTTPVAKIGDWVIQGNTAQLIVALPSPATMTLEDGTLIANGAVKMAAMTPQLDGAELDDFIADAMDFIDRMTRQWFNKRTKTLKMEGENVEVLMLPVPIITVTEIRPNGLSAPVMAMSEYIVFTSRSVPDDRRNPRIRVHTDPTSIFYERGRRFLRGVITEVDGSFGYLEEDGSTPRQITRATTKLAVMRALKSIGEEASESSASAGVGALKREKTDLHEVEYFDPNSKVSEALTQASGSSGDDEIDGIIAMYRAPILIGGSAPDVGIDSPGPTGWLD